MQQRRTAVGLCIALLLVECLMLPRTRPAEAQQKCAQDLNNDGDILQTGETATCIATPQGQLCPISAVTCSVVQTCPLGATYTCGSGTCSAPATCSPAGVLFLGPEYRCDATGIVYADAAQCASSCTQTAGCQTSYACPLGSQYPCMDNNGLQQCSPNACVDISTGTTTTTPDLSGYVNNGTIDPNSGTCLGQLYLFNGKGGQCRPPGVSTLYFDCCSLGSGGLLGFLRNCRSAEAETVAARDAKQCHGIGEYCVTSWRFLGCVQKASVFCCFNSMLGRIIHEQGRPQLKKFAPDGQWGTPTAPNCTGFTPEDFQMLDFSKIDLSEYMNTISTAVTNQLQQNMTDRVNTYMNNLQ